MSDSFADSRYFFRAEDMPIIEMSDVDAAGARPDDQGRCLVLIAKELNGSESMLVGLYYLAPGERHLLHHHPTEAEYYFVVDGEGVFTVGDEERRAGPGVAILLPPGTPHAVANDGDRDLCLLFGYDVGRADDVTMVWDE